MTGSRTGAAVRRRLGLMVVSEGNAIFASISTTPASSCPPGPAAIQNFKLRLRRRLKLLTEAVRTQFGPSSFETPAES